VIEALEKFDTRGDTAFGALQGTVVASLEISPLLSRRLVWAALNPYFAQISAGVTAEWYALGELRFSLNKIVVGKVPLKFGNALNNAGGDEVCYEMRGPSVAPSLWFGEVNGGAGDVVLFEVPCIPITVKADRADLFLIRRATTATVNFVYGLRIHSQL